MVSQNNTHGNHYYRLGWLPWETVEKKLGAHSMMLLKPSMKLQVNDVYGSEKLLISLPLQTRKANTAYQSSQKVT